MTRAQGGGPGMAEGPVDADGRGPQRDRQPDDGGSLGLFHIECRLDRQFNYSMAQPRNPVPRPSQLLARITQTLDTMEYYENRRIIAGLTKEELTDQLPLTGRRKTCSIRVVLSYVPDYVPNDR